MTDPVRAFRHFLARFSTSQEGRGAGTPDQGSGATPPEEPVAESAGEQPDRRRPGRGEVRSFPLSTRADREEMIRQAPEQEVDGIPSTRIASRVRAYLNAQAEAALSLLLEEMSGDTAREVGEALEKTHEALSHEIRDVREGVHTSQRELSRIGRELVRSGASLESMQAAVSALGPALERMEGSIRAQLMQEATNERRLREEAERAALEDILATLDGLEAGMEHGRELVLGLAEAQRRLKDTTVQRWWRAMGEATGVKRPIPDVPAAELDDWMAGLELTRGRLQDALARRGVTPIEAEGHPFDPHLHEAVAVETSSPEQDGLVVREERRGYRDSDRVIRLSQVVVGRASADRANTRNLRPRHTIAEHPPAGHEPLLEDVHPMVEHPERDAGADTRPQREDERHE